MVYLKSIEQSLIQVNLYHQFQLERSRKQKEDFMKVIKEGKQTANFMRVICKVCSSELEITADDLKQNSKGTIPLFTVSYRYKCPCCNSSIDIGYHELSEGILFDLIV